MGSAGGEPVDGVRLTHVGGPTVLLEVAGWWILTDPTFDAPGRRYAFGWGTSSREVAGPAVDAAALGPVDAVLLSHDHHADNLDDAGRALLPSAGVVVTTAAGARRLRGGARGLHPWQTTRLAAPGRPALQVTATPCRHGPPLSRPVAGDVIGFALAVEGQERGVLWVTGDSVLSGGLRRAARRLAGEQGVDLAVVHLGGVRFPVTGPLRYSMTGERAVELCRLARPRTVVPVHHEGWSHFRQGRAGAEAAFARAPAGVRDAVRWVPPGRPVDLSEQHEGERAAGG